MSTITEKLNYLDETKTAIKNAIVSKGVSVSDSDTFRSYADKISSITTSEGGGSTVIDEWQPQSDWWDIDTILEEDTEDYPAKMILLLTNYDDTNTFNINNSISKIVTSDGGTITSSNTVHNWDKTKDKECSLGYKTRYVIAYFNTTNAVCSFNSISKLTNSSYLYIILKNADLTIQSASGTTFINGNRLLERFKLNNSTLKGQAQTFANCNSLSGTIEAEVNGGFNFFTSCGCLEKVILKVPGSNTGLNYTFSHNRYLKEVIFSDDSDLSNIREYQDCFQSCSSLKRINKLDLNSADNINSLFNNCNSLISIDEIINIKKSGLNLSTCYSLNHDTLIRVLNALYDYASEGSTTTYTLTLGTTNLAKLTDDEKAIATNKGWTLN